MTEEILAAHHPRRIVSGDLKTLAGDERVGLLNKLPPRNGTYVLYWMQQAQRAEDNPALERALAAANALDLPLAVCFGLTDDYPEANLRHYAFMLQGIRETATALAARGIRFVLRLGSPDRVALALAADAALLVCDGGHLRHQRRWQQTVAEVAACPVVRVETDVIVPPDRVSTKAEYAARTLRPKIQRQVTDFLFLPAPTPTHRRADGLKLAGEAPGDLSALVARLSIDHSVTPVDRWFVGGTREAKRRFEAFLSKGLQGYAENANQPQTDGVSRMSPYLHFGQISPTWLALRVQEAEASAADRAAYLEQLVVRRELAINFVRHTPGYDTFDGLPDWARRSLETHRRDPRSHRYSPAQIEAGETHDAYWNAAMAEMRVTGFMHNTMRMYWGKQVLAWSPSPEAAYETLIRLNNRYSLDGRDPNTYAGVGWIFGLHDRPWPERPVFGKVRTMTASGLRRKYAIDAYVAKIAAKTKKNER
ncbi:MAG: deoxyribodipyrimidine photo-lyase [Desulfobacterales bacterium]|jgi:deoxyribodipyrimidine photo-lyase|nr:deoxyribodipyrimidine photo-lyase [Desulfobacterales bacterium]